MKLDGVLRPDYTPRMLKRLVLLVLLLTAPAWGQTNSKPYSREAAEKSFRALVTAKDSDITDLIKGDGLVCFGESSPLGEDRFLTIQLSKPLNWLEDKTSGDNSSEEHGSIYDGKTDLAVMSPGFLYFHEWINQDWTSVVDSMLDGRWRSVGHYERLKNGQSVWKPFNGMSPVFQFKKDKDEITGATDLSASEDGSTFYASKKYGNRNKGTTAYAMNIRLSTGRYKETWTPDKSDPIESVGNCYKAKEFVPPTPAKKTK